jgi:pyruvate dehydrogenase E1 component alpha subunit
MRRGGGPVFIECRTYRWREHVGPSEDYSQGYRARSDLEPWIEGDQMESLGARLAADRRASIDADIEREIADAVVFAEKSPFPDLKALYTNVFA